MIRIEPGDFRNADVLALLRAHLAGMHENSPPGAVQALDLTGMQRPDVSFFVAYRGDALAGMGALRELDRVSGEIKSMRTHADHLGKGVGAAILDHLLAVARARNYARVSLETGSTPAFQPALALYRKRGFVEGAPFGDYAVTTFNRFYHLDLKGPRPNG